VRRCALLENSKFKVCVFVELNELNFKEIISAVVSIPPSVSWKLSVKVQRHPTSRRSFQRFLPELSFSELRVQEVNIIIFCVGRLEKRTLAWTNLKSEQDYNNKITYRYFLYLCKYNFAYYVWWTHLFGMAMRACAFIQFEYSSLLKVKFRRGSCTHFCTLMWDTITQVCDCIRVVFDVRVSIISQLSMSINTYSKVNTCAILEWNEKMWTFCNRTKIKFGCAAWYDSLTPRPPTFRIIAPLFPFLSLPFSWNR